MFVSARCSCELPSRIKLCYAKKRRLILLLFVVMQVRIEFEWCFLFFTILVLVLTSSLTVSSPLNLWIMWNDLYMLSIEKSVWFLFNEIWLLHCDVILARFLSKKYENVCLCYVLNVYHVKKWNCIVIWNHAAFFLIKTKMYFSEAAMKTYC